jgi:hypothetical protein
LSSLAPSPGSLWTQRPLTSAPALALSVPARQGPLEVQVHRSRDDLLHHQVQRLAVTLLAPHRHLVGAAAWLPALLALPL